MQRYGWTRIEINKSDDAEMLVYSYSLRDLVERAGEEMILFWWDDVYLDAS